LDEISHMAAAMDMKKAVPMSSDESDIEMLLDQRPAVPNMRRKSLYVVTSLLLSAAAAMYAKGAFSRAEVHSPERMVIQKYEETVVVPPREQCSKPTQNCMSTKCCKTTGYKCFQKDAGYASCKAECNPAKDGWCTELVNLKPMHTVGQRLFCFSFYTENTGAPDLPSELDLFQAQIKLGVSLFGCPKWAIFSDVTAELSPGVSTIKVDDVDGDFHLFKRKKMKTWVNAMMFYQAWLNIRANKLTAGSDWVVKVDADAVFLPLRLVHTVASFKVPAGGCYIENCAKVMYGFFGNLEVVSSDGFASFLSNLETCKADLDWKGEDPDWKYGPWGEDLFMQKCMDKIGVAKVSNFTLSYDGVCKADRPKDIQKVKNLKWHPFCNDANSVSYHPFKKPAGYFQCLALTQKVEQERQAER